MKLLLINPTITGEPEANHLGLVTVGTYLQKKTHHRARVLDFAFYHGRDWKVRLAEELAEYRPDVVGMYISTPYFPSAKVVADEVKRLYPKIPMLAGGHHATLAPHSVMAHPAFDMLVIGEGEIPVVKLLDAMEAGRPLDEVPGLWFRRGGDVVKIDKGPPLDAAEIPALDWDLYDEKTLRQSFFYFGAMPVMGSRGCPNKCSFCAITNVQELYAGQKFLRFRDPVAVVDEIEQNYRRFKPMGMRIVHFYDLNFLVAPKWLRAFTNEYRRRGLHRELPWSAYTRGDHINDEVLEALRDSGCINLRVGVEAANEEVRNSWYNKELPQAQLEAALESIKALGISITGYFLVGGPGERPEHLMESMEFAYDHGIEYPAFFLYKPLAGTDVLEQAGAMGSFIDASSMEEPADYMRGVNMVHRHITRQQIVVFHFLTQAVFGARIVSHQVRAERMRFFHHLARYSWSAMKDGFTLYESLIYYTFYGDGHLITPHLFPRQRERPLAWRALFKLLRLYMRSTKGEAADFEETPGSIEWRAPETATLPKAPTVLIKLKRAPKLVSSHGSLK